MPRLKRFVLCASLVLLLMALSPGCSGGGKADPNQPALAPVSGTVMYKGKPLKDAAVTFNPQGPGNPANGRTDESGRYVLTTSKENDGAVVGFHVVTVQVMPEGGLPGAEVASTGATPIPAKYAEKSKSPLTVEVKQGPNNLELKLED